LAVRRSRSIYDGQSFEVVIPPAQVCLLLRGVDVEGENRHNPWDTLRRRG
jgi:hypothetical protein